MRELILSIKRTPFQSLASFLILFFTLFLFLTFFNLLSFFYAFLSYIETRPQVIVYFQQEVSQDDIFNLRETLLNSGKVSQVKYISKEEALKIYKELNKDNPLLLEMVSAEILPASLEIYAKRPEYFSEIVEFLKKQPGVDEVQFQKNIVDRLLTLTSTLRKIFIVIFCFVLFISFLVLMTTTAFKIVLKKEEIELLSLLGASRFFIIKPYLLEGIFFGGVAGVFSSFIFYLVFFYFQPFLKSYLFGIPSLSFFNFSHLNLYVWPPSLEYILFSSFVTIFGGITIGLIGNYLSTRKYLN